MELSNYVKVYSGDDNDRLLLYSTRKGSKMLIRRKTFEAIDKGDLTDSDRDVLAKMKMIVPSRAEERAEMLSLFERLNRKNTELEITIVLNLDCNFDCVYCYEGKMKGNKYMSQETEESLVEFVRKRFTERHTSLYVTFYGGEPLLSMDRIRSFAKRLAAFCQSRGAEFGFGMTSNGSLLTRKRAEELSALGMGAVKVTLDGVAETHNRTRPFKGGKGSFDCIIENLKGACELMRIGILGVYDRENWRKYLALIDYLPTVGLGPSRIHNMKFGPVMNSPDGSAFQSGYDGGCGALDEPWVLEASLALREALLKRGYRTDKPSPLTCMVEIDDSLVVNYDGEIYKCPAFLGQEAFAAGDLSQGIGKFEEAYRLGFWNKEECAECTYLPLCFGGCRYQVYSTRGSIDGTECRKGYFDANLETLIRQDMQYQRE